jgi:hypothetical protein
MSTSIQRHALGLTWVETGGMRRAAHAVRADGRVWLIDPFEDGVALSAAAELGQAAGVIQLLDRHNRDCDEIAQRLEVPRLRVPTELPNSPFAVVSVISRPWWREVALWWEQERALIVAEAVGTAPAFALGRRVGAYRPLAGAAAGRPRLGDRFRRRIGAPRRALGGALRHPAAGPEAPVAHSRRLSRMSEISGPWGSTPLVTVLAILRTSV